MKYIHLRYEPDADNPQYGVSPFDNHGGLTVAYQVVEQPDSCYLNAAVTVCSLGDNFSRKKGRQIAEHRFFAEAPSWFVSVPIDSPKIQPLKTIDVIEELGVHFPEYFAPWLDHEGFVKDNVFGQSKQ